MLDDGQILTEVGVICQYLADQTPAGGLISEFASDERYHHMEALNFSATEIHKQVGALFNPAMRSEMKEVQIGTIGRRFNALEQMLEGKPYVMADGFSVADAYLFTVLNWTGIHNIDLEKWPNIKAFIARVGARPKVQEAMKAEGLLKQALP